MNAINSMLSADPGQIETFAGVLFRYADPESYLSLRAFREGVDGPPFALAMHSVGREPTEMVRAAVALANRCARVPDPTVFCPPVATFQNRDAGAAEANLANGLALSVECDSRPLAAREQLEALLGPATIVVASGGEWPDPETGVLEPKQHLHWRLTEPTCCPADHALLKQARALAAALVGADVSNTPIVHPIRWPGSWHRKGRPQIARIVSLNADREIDLTEALDLLQQASPRTDQPAARSTIDFGEPETGESRRTDELVEAILSGRDYHAPLVAMAMRFQKAGMPDAQVASVLRGFMQAVPSDRRDVKDGVSEPGRWQARYNDIPRAVSTGRAKLGSPSPQIQDLDIGRFRLDAMTIGSPPPRQFLLEPYIPLGTAGLLVAAGGTGKSMMALDLCLSVARRALLPSTDLLLGPLGGSIPHEAGGATIFLTLEDDAAEIHRRTDSLDPSRGREGAPCYVIPGVDLPEFDPYLVVANGRAAALTEFAREGILTLLDRVARASGHPVRLLVLDPAGDFLNADENDAAYVKPLMRRLREICAQRGCTILLLGHVAKSIEADGPSMRGSSAWVFNSRFAISLWRPLPEEARSLAEKASVRPEALVWANLIKANHAGAPIGQKRLLARDGKSGRLLDVSGQVAKPNVVDEEALLDMLVEACREYAAAGLPFAHTGVAGLWQGREDLPPALADMAKHRLEDLGRKALQQHRLTKARTTASQGAPKYLDVPDGPLSLGAEIIQMHGSRREALARLRGANAP